MNCHTGRRSALRVSWSPWLTLKLTQLSLAGYSQLGLTLKRQKPELGLALPAGLPASAKAFRAAHALVGVIELSCLGYVWACALARRRDRLLGAAMVILSLQGVGMVIGRGNCPLGPLQRRLGDPTPLFELVLPPRAAKVVFPVLLAVALGGVLGVALRPPGQPSKSAVVKRQASARRRARRRLAFSRTAGP
jgi:hypothetical protein